MIMIVVSDMAKALAHPVKIPTLDEVKKGQPEVIQKRVPPPPRRSFQDNHLSLTHIRSPIGQAIQSMCTHLLPLTKSTQHFALHYKQPLAFPPFTVAHVDSSTASLPACLYYPSLRLVCFNVGPSTSFMEICLGRQWSMPLLLCVQPSILLSTHASGSSG
jgi:hypothetical protein